jgi:aspartate oxidase
MGGDNDDANPLDTLSERVKAENARIASTQAPPVSDAVLNFKKNLAHAAEKELPVGMQVIATMVLLFSVGVSMMYIVTTSNKPVDVTWVQLAVLFAIAMAALGIMMFDPPKYYAESYLIRTEMLRAQGLLPASGTGGDDQLVEAILALRARKSKTT